MSGVGPSSQRLHWTCLDTWNAPLLQEGILRREPEQQEREHLGPGCSLRASGQEMCFWKGSLHLYLYHCRACVGERDISKPRRRQLLHTIHHKHKDVCVSVSGTLAERWGVVGVVLIVFSNGKQVPPAPVLGCPFPNRLKTPAFRTHGQKLSWQNM